MANDLDIVERDGLGLATVMARKGVTAPAIGAALGLDAPRGPTSASNGQLRLIGTGPGMWMAIADTAGADWVDGLRTRLTGIASVSDQSGGYVIFRISGPSARSTLQKGVFIDLDPSVFGAGSVATTVVAHIGVTLWQVDAAPTFEAALFRSLSRSFREWLESVATR
ncbi:sarcosine oxidase subunit gamma [Bradyrhizobium canariense]|uniref:sarcosine oxidase subunit gamma n=1 Tax=Bradyrhizobium canariense TaxID=255045 RepID=UPI0011BA60F5|nr:sarcosine oxidase subunit gamma family protein [Bradyrhizobium canariense]